MGRKSPSRSAVVAQNLARRPGRRPRCGRTADLQHLAHAARAHRADSLDKASFTVPAGAKATDITALKVTDDFPEIPTVLDRELGAIETFLGALLDEILGED
jgi:hypothetical protein